MPRLSLSIVAFALLPLLAGCPQKDSAKGEPPPPPPPASAAAAGACANGGGEIRDMHAPAFFPRMVGGYCVDPNGETKSYGESAKHPKEEVCTTLFDGECEIYMQYKLTRVVALRYVDGAGKGATVDVILSAFADPTGAYGMFTKRVIAGSDPAESSAPKPFTAGGAAVLGTGRAYVWRGQHVLELQYNNEQESPDQLAKSSAAILPVIAREVGEKLPGDLVKPTAAKLLPEANLVSKESMELLTKEPLGLKGVGAAAVGYYKDGDKRYRAVTIPSADADQAKDLMKTLAKRPEALPLTGVADEGAYVVIKQGELKVNYVFARKGTLVAGIGDEDFVKPAEFLSKEEKVAKLKAWLTAAAVLPAASSSAAAPSKAADAGKK